jgi:nucleoside-diphosphate-sugar epimerase
MTRPVVVTGASGQIGWALLPRLAEQWQPVSAVSRERPGWAQRSTGIEWHQADLRDGWPEGLACERLVHAGPLELAVPLIRPAADRGLNRLVAFSSTSLLVKADSADPAERALIQRLAAAEADLERACREAGVSMTLLRPTLIYGAGLDASVTPLAALMRRWRFMVLPGPGRGRRQPVHVADLADAVLSALEQPAAAGGVYTLAGGSILSYRRMLETLFRAQGLRPRFLTLPAGLCRAGIRALRVLPRYRQLSPALVDRVEQDLVFDDSEARARLGWRPRAFAPTADTLRPPGPQ